MEEDTSSPYKLHRGDDGVMLILPNDVVSIYMVGEKVTRVSLDERCESLNISRCDRAKLHLQPHVTINNGQLTSWYD